MALGAASSVDVHNRRPAHRTVKGPDKVNANKVNANNRGAFSPADEDAHNPAGNKGLSQVARIRDKHYQGSCGGVPEKSRTSRTSRNYGVDAEVGPSCIVRPRCAELAAYVVTRVPGAT